MLISGLGATLPEPIAGVRRRALAALRSLPPVDSIVVLAAGPAGAVFAGPVEASLAGSGAPDAAVQAKSHNQAAAVIADAAGYQVIHGPALPVDHAALVLLLAQAGPPAVGAGPADGDAAPLTVTPAAVPALGQFDELSAAGAAIAESLAAAELRVAVVAAGDLSAALTPSAPVFLGGASHEWDAQVLAALRDGMVGLRALGPDQAARVGARGWAPLAMAHGMLATAGRSLSSLRYAAPCGVGYVVAADR